MTGLSKRLGMILIATLKILWSFVARLLKWTTIGLAATAVLMFALNVAFHSQRGIPYRGLDPQSSPCREAGVSAWQVLDTASGTPTANDEWSAIDHHGDAWRQRLSCSIQSHALPGYRGADGAVHDLGYDLAFIEFHEDGKPYALRSLCDADATDCSDEGYGPVRELPKSQLSAIIDRLDPGTPHYVMVFVHGWRHDAEIGDKNVEEFRSYALHAARFIEDRWSGKTTLKPRVMAIYVGWRGARTDETWLKRRLGAVGEWIGDFSAILTLFDRKPVSEAIAPSVLSGLRAIEDRLGLEVALQPGWMVPERSGNRMLVFGHSLGGNLLATALKDDLVKAVTNHAPGSYMSPVLGDLTVLINPASEATKWVDVQRSVWSRITLSKAERRPLEDYLAAHKFFQRNQPPVIVAVTAARDWPPGGRTELDCFAADVASRKKAIESKGVVAEGFNYDWATYDMFPAFKGDLRPAADTIKRLAWGTDPHDACDATRVSAWRRVLGAPLVALGALMRILPFMQTDPIETRTIGHLDPPRSPISARNNNYVTAWPFGTTHELRGLDSAQARSTRYTTREQATSLASEKPLTYEQVVTPYAACPVATSWLLIARNEAERRDRLATGGENHGVGWDSEMAGARAPALEFRHGFQNAGLAPITRANDPFWNMRAFDSALARHDGYMLSSFICAMNQLVMDDIVRPDPAFQPTP